MLRRANRREFIKAITAAGAVGCLDTRQSAAEEQRTLVVDSHVHCFGGKTNRDFPYHPRGPYQPEPAFPELLLERMKQAGVDRAVIVHPEPYQDDHRYLWRRLRRQGNG